MPIIEFTFLICMFVSAFRTIKEVSQSDKTELKNSLSTMLKTFAVTLIGYLVWKCYWILGLIGLSLLFKADFFATAFRKIKMDREFKRESQLFFEYLSLEIKSGVGVRSAFVRIRERYVKSKQLLYLIDHILAGEKIMQAKGPSNIFLSFQDLIEVQNGAVSEKLEYFRDRNQLISDLNVAQSKAIGPFQAQVLVMSCLFLGLLTYHFYRSLDFFYKFEFVSSVMLFAFGAIWSYKLIRGFKWKS